MRRKSRVTPLAALVVLALLATFSGPLVGSDGRVTAGTIDYRLCDIVVKGPPLQAAQGVAIVPSVIRPDGPRLFIKVWSAGVLEPVLDIDAKSGVAREVVSADSTLPADQLAAVEEVRASKRSTPLNPQTAPWPYTDATQVPAKWGPAEEGTVFKYRIPDPGSGLVVSKTFVNTIDGSVVQVLRVENCRSYLQIEFVQKDGGNAELTTRYGQHSDPSATSPQPEDSLALRNFLEELEPVR